MLLLLIVWPWCQPWLLPKRQPLLESVRSGSFSHLEVNNDQKSFHFNRSPQKDGSLSAMVGGRVVGIDECGDGVAASDLRVASKALLLHLLMTSARSVSF